MGQKKSLASIYMKFIDIELLLLLFNKNDVILFLFNLPSEEQYHE